MKKNTLYNIGYVSFFFLCLCLWVGWLNSIIELFGKGLGYSINTIWVVGSLMIFLAVSSELSARERTESIRKVIRNLVRAELKRGKR